jgi:hypothetical protein
MKSFLSIFLLIPVFGYAQTTLITIFDAFSQSIGATTSFLMALALAVFIWGVVLFVAKAGDDTERAKGKKRIVWGIIGLVVIVSLWGIVTMLKILVGVPQGGNASTCPSPSIDITVGGVVVHQC